MKTLFSAIVICLLAIFGHSQNVTTLDLVVTNSTTTLAIPAEWSKVELVSRIWSSTNATYSVEYAYRPFGPSFTPAVMGPVQEHYEAQITVYEIGSGKKTQIGKSFKGVYVPGGCFEDVPENLVNAALNQKDK